MTSENALSDPADVRLQGLRHEIDGIDRALHALLMERGELIDKLIAAKARAGGGSAFRPAREADMMRRLVERHRGILPLDTVEGIWRIIIATFTYVQAPYAVHAALGDGPLAAAVRDSCRFHFGFTVPLDMHPGVGDVVDAVAEAKGDLGLVPVSAADAAWWETLRAPEAPKIIARLPFVERADHAAGLPLFVLARPLAEAMPHDVLLYAVSVSGGGGPRPGGPVEIVAKAQGDGVSHYLAAAPEPVSAEAVSIAFQVPGTPEPPVSLVGAHAARFKVTGSGPTATSLS